MTNSDGSLGAVPDELVTMTREQLQGERDAWYANGIRNGEIRWRALWKLMMAAEDRIAAR